MPDPLIPLVRDAILASLTTRTMGRTLRLLDETTSTNTQALEAAQSGAPDGTVIIAERQTAGRGRLARTWESPAGCNLYVSVIVRQLPPMDRLGWLPLITASAMAAAIRSLTGLPPALKWPNDVMLGGKKVGGVLCESQALGTDAACVVVGIGLNVNWRESDMPPEIRPLATSLAAQSRKPADRVRLLAILLLELERRIDRWRNGELSSLADEYRTHCGTIGQAVRVELGTGKQVEGMVTAIESDGALRIAAHRGSTSGDHIVRSGDVVHLRPQRSEHAQA